MSSWCKESGRSLLYGRGSSHVRHVHSLTELLLFSTCVFFFFYSKWNTHSLKYQLCRFFCRRTFMPALETVWKLMRLCMRRAAHVSDRTVAKVLWLVIWEESVHPSNGKRLFFFLLMCIYKARDGLLLEKNFGISLVRSISCHSVIRV